MCGMRKLQLHLSGEKTTGAEYPGDEKAGARCKKSEKIEREEIKTEIEKREVETL